MGRKSNFELLRIFAMMLVLLVHANYLSLGSVTQSEITTSPFGGFVRIFCEQLCIVSVNLFVLISGWFGIRPTLKKFATLLFQILFIGLSSILACKVAGIEVPTTQIKSLLYLGSHYWFIPAYLILFFFAPVLNAFCERAEKREFAIVLVTFFCLQTVFGWLTDIGHYATGYSAISFMGLYLLAQYIRRHDERLRALKWWQSFLFYLLFTIIPTIIAYVGLYLKNRDFGADAYSSLFVIAASASLLLMFSRFEFESRLVNWLSSSAFAIYLVHQAPGIDKLYTNLFESAYQSMHGGVFISFAIITVAIIGIVCILFDKLRIAIWELLLKLKQCIIK